MLTVNNVNISHMGESELSEDLTVDYGETRLVLQLLEPKTIHAHWEITMQDRCRLSKAYGNHFVLRIHNVDALKKEEYWFAEEIAGCFLGVDKSSSRYRGELGFYEEERFRCIALSEIVSTPADLIISEETTQTHKEAKDTETNPEDGLAYSDENRLPVKLLKVDPKTGQIHIVLAGSISGN